MNFISTLAESRYLLTRRAFGSLFCVLVMFYLGFHAVSGERGLFALFKETRRLEMITAELSRVKAEREALEKKTHLLSDNSIDLDMLDERARVVLGYAGKNEVVSFDEKDSDSKAIK
jgi:cell division protein FtsB